MSRSSSSSKSSSCVISIPSWEVGANKYLPPFTGKLGQKSIGIISRKTSSTIYLSTPLLSTFGVSDFTDETGVSNEKYSMSLMFPNPDYADAGATLFLEKLKAFEEQITQDVADHSGQWFNEEIPVEFVKRMFSPMLKYRKNKDPSVKSKFDYSAPPSLSVKVPYDKNTNQWKCEIYDSSSKQLFPSTTTQYTPIDLIPKMSKVACVIQCGGIWYNGKAWGITWKLIQCVVKPKEVVSIQGVCHIQLSEEDKDVMDKQEIVDDTIGEPNTTHVEDDEPVAKAPAVIVAPKLKITVPAEPTPAVVVAPKKVVAPVVTAEPEPEPAVEEVAPAEPVVVKTAKKVVKPKATK